MSESSPNTGLRLIDGPKVYLIGQQVIDEDTLNDFLADQDVGVWATDTDVAGERLIETAGRVCYMSFARPRPGGNAAYIGHILEVGHGSVLEHAVFNILITGISRSLSHELVRHRAGFSYSQLSQRYVDESACEFVVPPALAEEVAAAQKYIQRSGGHVVNAWNRIRRDFPDGSEPASLVAGLHWIAAVDGSVVGYKHLSDYLNDKYADIDDKTARRKAAREAARSVLPNATETKVFVTVNGRAARHFIEMRANLAADAEICRLSVQFFRVLSQAAPHLFQDMEVVSSDGREHITARHRKV